MEGMTPSCGRGSGRLIGTASIGKQRPIRPCPLILRHTNRKNDASRENEPLNSPYPLAKNRILPK